MADTGRQSFTDKAASAAKPNSEKSYVEQIGDSMKSTADSIASTVQPQSEKSTTQKMGDTVSGNSNHNQESLMDKAKNAFGVEK
ncbi:heat shock protein 9/12-domain-containing protein [Lenzites betulinus]|nr:heat shock protein 9/12-domain-containing protein [Lenzites betulinus]